MIVELIMKRNNEIASLFQKHEAKKIASSVVIDDEHIEDTGLVLVCVDPAPPVPPIQSDSKCETEVEDATPNPPSPQLKEHTLYSSGFVC